jgi:hypothetical protein
LGAFLTSLASIGSEYGQAKIDKSQEDFARAEKLKQIDAQQAYLDLAKQSEARQQAEFEQRKKAGDLIEMKDGRIWSVSKGSFIDQQKPDPMTTLQKFIKSQPQEVQKQLSERAQAEIELDPADPKKAIQEVMRYADETSKESRQAAEREAERKTRHTEHEEDVTTTREFQRQQKRESEKFQRQMVDIRLQEKSKQMSPVERKSYDSLRLMEPMVENVMKFIEDNKLEKENDLVFGDRSALMQHLRQKGYAFGQKQEPITQKLFKDMGVLAVQGAAPFMTMGRSVKMYEEVAKHLPKQTDTPSNLYDKLKWMHEELFPNVRSSLSGYTAPDTGKPINGEGDVPPPGSVIHDFSK